LLFHDDGINHNTSECGLKELLFHDDGINHNTSECGLKELLLHDDGINHNTSECGLKELLFHDDGINHNTPACESVFSLLASFTTRMSSLTPKSNRGPDFPLAFVLMSS
jgi:hypothetical protein